MSRLFDLLLEVTDCQLGSQTGRKTLLNVQRAG
jgi:hypothetical protein